jgi:hypothetical protein
MKYMIMTFGSAAEMVESASMDWIREMIQFMRKIDLELRDSGELVYQQGLADSAFAKLVTYSETGDSSVVPLSRSESLIGFWIVDVATEVRAMEIATQISKYAGAVEVRPALDEPPVAG